MVDIAQIRQAYATMNANDKQNFLQHLGITDINKGLKYVNLPNAIEYLKSYNIQIYLEDNSAWVQAKNKNENKSKHEAASKKYEAWANITKYATAMESTNKSLAAESLKKAQKTTTPNGNMSTNSEAYRKYITYTNEANTAYSLFRQSLDNRNMATDEMRQANNLAAMQILNERQKGLNA